MNYDLFAKPQEVELSEPVAPLSELAQLYHDWKQGKIQESDYFAMNAMWIAGHLSEYRPRCFTPMHKLVSDYVEGRETGSKADTNLGAKLGAWIQATTQLREEHESNRRLLVWAMNHLRGKAEMLADRIQFFLPTWDHSDYEFPERWFSRSLSVQKRDSSLRAASEYTRRKEA